MRILLVGRAAALPGPLVQALRLAGCDMLQAGDAEEARRVMRRFGQSMDLVVTTEPGLAGEFKKNYPNLKALCIFRPIPPQPSRRFHRAGRRDNAGAR